MTSTVTPPLRRTPALGRVVEVVGLAVLAYVPFLLSSPGDAQRGHQAVPLPRPRPPARARAVPVGPARRRRHGAPPAHRLPVPDGAVLLGHGRPRRARLGRPAPLARHDLARRRARGAVAVHDAGGPPRRRARRRARLHAHAVPAGLHRAHLGPAAAVGGPAVARRPHHARRPARRVARPSAVRARHLAVGGVNASACVLVGIGPAALARARGLPRSGRSALGAAGRGGSDRRADASASRLVDRRAAAPGRLRAARPPAHREPADRRRGARSRTTCCAGSATGSSTAATGSGTPSTRPATTPERRRGRRQLRGPGGRPSWPPWSCAGATGPTSPCSSSSARSSASAPGPSTTQPVRRGVEEIRRRLVARSRPAQHPAGRARRSCSASPGCWPRRVGAAAPRAGPTASARRGRGRARRRRALAGVADGYLSERRRATRGPPRVLDRGGRRPRGRRRRRPACSRSRAPTSPPTGGATPSNPITPGLIDRPYLAREVLPYGLAAVGRTCSTPSTAASSRDVSNRRRWRRSRGSSGSARSCCAPTSQYERYRHARGPACSGLRSPTRWRRASSDRSASAPPTRNTADPPSSRCSTSSSCARPTSAADPPPVALFDVRGRGADRARGARPPSRWCSAGDGDGIVDAAAAGLLDGRALVLRAGRHGRRRSCTPPSTPAPTSCSPTPTAVGSRTGSRRSRDTRGATERAGRDAPTRTATTSASTSFPEVRRRRAARWSSSVGGRVDATGDGGIGPARGPRRRRLRRRRPHRVAGRGVRPAGRAARAPDRTSRCAPTG